MKKLSAGFSSNCSVPSRTNNAILHFKRKTGRAGTDEGGRIWSTICTLKLSRTNPTRCGRRWRADNLGTSTSCKTTLTQWITSWYAGWKATCGTSILSKVRKSLTARICNIMCIYPHLLHFVPCRYIPITITTYWQIYGPLKHRILTTLCRGRIIKERSCAWGWASCSRCIVWTSSITISIL